MNHKEKAKQLANIFVRKSVFDMSNEELVEERIYARKEAMKCVDEIVEAVVTTTSHCTLNKIDAEEVDNDCSYWGKVKHEISLL